MIVRTTDLSGAAKKSAGAAGLNIQHNVRGRAAISGIEAHAMTDRRIGARPTAFSRGASGCNCGTRGAEPML